MGGHGDLILESGGVLVLGGPSRRAFHGIDKVLPGTSPLPALPYGAARINLTRIATGIWRPRRNPSAGRL